MAADDERRRTRLGRAALAALLVVVALASVPGWARAGEHAGRQAPGAHAGGPGRGHRSLQQPHGAAGGHRSLHQPPGLGGSQQPLPGAAGRAPLGAAGPPPVGAAGPPPLGAAGPPPVGATGPGARDVIRARPFEAPAREGFAAEPGNGGGSGSGVDEPWVEDPWVEEPEGGGSAPRPR